VTIIPLLHLIQPIIKTPQSLDFPAGFIRPSPAKTGSSIVFDDLKVSPKHKINTIQPHTHIPTGYRLTNENALLDSVKPWKRVDNGGVVSIVEAFTSRNFGDSSLIFVYDYHPVSKTLVEAHFTNNARYHRSGSPISEQVIWGYIVQVASAMKSVHAENLAIRCMNASKVVLTETNRIRFGACSILDVVHHDVQKTMTELQQEDFYHFGRLILSLATSNPAPNQTSIEQLPRLYSKDLRSIIHWLLTPELPEQSKTIDVFLPKISTYLVASLNSSLQAEDELRYEMSRELENGRIARLLMKLGTINERQDYAGDRNWGETGERYLLTLFRDYVFHQVDASGSAVIDLGHIVTALNKLDAGSDERIMLTSRDEQSQFVVTYKDLKKQVAAAFSELTKTSRPNRGF
jgi:PAB-dependent poly(A)-specific ribonuclease subunit 3